MADLLIHPGEEGELCELLDLLRAQHDEVAAARQREIDERRIAGTPLDDAADWPKIDEVVGRVRAAVIARDSPAARLAASELLGATAGALVPLAPFRGDPLLAGVCVRFRVLEERRRRALAAAEAKALTALARAFQADDPVASAAATDAVFDARGALLTESLVEAHVGEQQVAGPSGVDLAVLERNSLLTPIAQAASAFQELGPKKVRRSGSSLGSTLGASSAPSVPSSDDVRGGVMGAPSVATGGQPSSPAPDGPPPPVPGGT